MEQRFFRVKNFEKYQPNRKERTAPWIRLYSSWNNDWAIGQLVDSHKAHFTGILLLAHGTNNQIPWDSKWIKTQIQAKSNVKIEVFERLGLIELVETKQESQESKNVPESSRGERRGEESCTETSLGTLKDSKTAKQASTLIGFYDSEFERIFKVKAEMNYGRDGAILMGLEIKYGKEAVKSLITKFLECDDDWINGTGRSVMVMKSQVQKLLIGKSSNINPNSIGEAII